jgi:hypothetical protein
MKERSVFIRTDNLTQMTEILRKHNAGGISFYEINGADRGKRDAIQEIVEAYTTGRSIITDEKRTKDETIVPDWRFIRRQTKLEVFAN